MSEIMPGWYNYANCAESDPEAFFYNETTSLQKIEEAKRICQRCLVAEYCLRYAMENDIAKGIWGGKTAVERQQLRRGNKNDEGRFI